MHDFSRLKNHRLWLAIFALIPLVLEGFNISVLPSNYNEIVTLVLSILVMGGILTNPTSDSEKEDKGAKRENIKENREVCKENMNNLENKEDK